MKRYCVMCMVLGNGGNRNFELGMKQIIVNATNEREAKIMAEKEMARLYPGEKCIVAPDMGPAKAVVEC